MGSKDDNLNDDDLTYDDKLLILQMLEHQYCEAEEMYRYLHSMHNFSNNSNLEQTLEYQKLVVLGLKQQYFDYEQLMLLESNIENSYTWVPSKE